MITVNEFRSTNQLTDRKWRTMKERFRSEHPGIDFTVREGMDYYISDSALPIFESYLPTQKGVQSTGAIVPTSSRITTSQISALTVAASTLNDDIQVIETEFVETHEGMKEQSAMLAQAVDVQGDNFKSGLNLMLQSLTQSTREQVKQAVMAGVALGLNDAAQVGKSQAVKQVAENKQSLEG